VLSAKPEDLAVFEQIVIEYHNGYAGSEGSWKARGSQGIPSGPNLFFNYSEDPNLRIIDLDTRKR